MICELKTQLLKYIAMLFIENNYLCKQTYQSFIMDTISVGINQTGNEQFVTWIIIAVVFIFIIILFLLKIIKERRNKVEGDGIIQSSSNVSKEKPIQISVPKPCLGNKLSEDLVQLSSQIKKSKEIVKSEIIPFANELKNNSRETSFSIVKEKDVNAPSIMSSMALELIAKEDYSKFPKPKYIGYNPINIFTQTEPLNYPYVIMPSKSGCVIKFPQKGRTGRKGYKEDDFLQYIRKYFKETFKIYDDRYVLTKKNRYEPDISLLNEKDGINIFLDIEIDEPYEGINDIKNRKPTHFRFADINRNNEFKNRGWIVIRFAEIQIHQNPDGCCRFIADVIKSIYPQFNIPLGLVVTKRIEPVLQWTKELALNWSAQNYREQYLGIGQFGYIPIIQETDFALIQDEEVEKEVVDDKPIALSEKNSISTLSQNIIDIAIRTNKYIVFQYEKDKTIVKPTKYKENAIAGYCYVKNMIRSFDISKMEDIHLKSRYYTLRLSASELGIQTVANMMNIIIPNHKYVRMEYTKPARSFVTMDPETNKLIQMQTKAETSIRTISDIQLDTEGWGENYIRAYCHKREEGRTFYFGRISLLEILDL
jgi:hypothetical protein